LRLRQKAGDPRYPQRSLTPVDHHNEQRLLQLAMANNQKPPVKKQPSITTPNVAAPSAAAWHKLEDYQRQLMHLGQSNKRRLQRLRREQNRIDAAERKRRRVSKL